MPVIDSVIYINNRICKSVIETTALSKDLQFVSIGVAINYRISNAIALVSNQLVPILKKLLLIHLHKKVLKQLLQNIRRKILFNIDMTQKIKFV